jgi:hypothetical protein
LNNAFDAANKPNNKIINTIKFETKLVLFSTLGLKASIKITAQNI